MSTSRIGNFLRGAVWWDCGLFWAGPKLEANLWSLGCENNTTLPAQFNAILCPTRWTLNVERWTGRSAVTNVTSCQMCRIYSFRNRRHQKKNDRAWSIDPLLTNFGTPVLRHSKADVTLHFRRDLLNNENSTVEFTLLSKSLADRSILLRHHDENFLPPNALHKVVVTGKTLECHHIASKFLANGQCFVNLGDAASNEFRRVPLQLCCQS